MKLTSLIKVATVTILIGGSSAVTLADDPQDGCDLGMVPNIVYQTLDSKSQLAFLKTVTKDNFEQKKRQAGGSFSFKRINPINKLTETFDLGGNYESFAARRAQLFELEQYQESLDLATVLLESHIPVESREGFYACKIASFKNQAEPKYGLHMLVTRQDPAGAEVTIFYNPTGGEKGKVEIDVLKGGTALGGQTGTMFPKDVVFNPFVPRIVSIARKEAGEISGTLAVNGIQKSFTVPALPAYDVTVSLVPTGTHQAAINGAHADRQRFGGISKVETRTRPTRVCMAADSRPTKVDRIATAPIPRRPHPSSGCYQAVSSTIAPDASPNCMIVNVSYKLCPVPTLPGPFKVPNQNTYEFHAWTRSLNKGIPVTIDYSGIKETRISLDPHHETAAFEGARSFRYPEGKIPPSVVNVAYTYVATVRDLRSGTTVMLDSAHPKGGGFEAISDEGGARVTIVRNSAQPVSSFGSN